MDMKTFNMKQIKNDMKRIYCECITMYAYNFENYTEYYNTMRNMYNYGFLTYEQWNDIYDYDTWLFKTFQTSTDVINYK